MCGLDGSGLVEVPLVVDIEALEGIGKGEDLVLLELRKFPVVGSDPLSLALGLNGVGWDGPLQLEDIHVAGELGESWRQSARVASGSFSEHLRLQAGDKLVAVSECDALSGRRMM